MNKEFRRKLIHILIGLIAFAFLYLDRVIIALIIVFFLSCALIANKFPTIYNYIIREKELKLGLLLGVITYTSSMLLLTLMFDPRIASAGIISLAWGDGFASILGRYGKLKIHGNKTVEGSLSMLTFSFIGSLLCLSIIPYSNSIISAPVQLGCYSILIASIISSVLATIAELYTEHDNISAPLTQAISLSILLNLL